MTRLRRWAPWALLAVVAAVVLGIGLHRPSHPTLDSQVTHIANEVRCPVCDGETAAQSDAAPSVEIRSVIRQELQAGESSDQILSGLVRSYGKGILEKPQPTGIGLVVWVVPVVAAALGLAGLALAFARWRERPWVESPPPPPDGGGSPAEVIPVGPAESTLPTGPVAVRTMPTRLSPPGLRTAIERPPPKGGRRRWPLVAAGAALATGGVCWALVASTSTRLTGQTISGQTLGPQAIATDLQQARQYAAKGDQLNAIKAYQKILASDPTQFEALTEEGWLLSETQQPQLLRQGIQMLTSAESADPSYAPAHVYRGIALLSEDDYTDSIPELQWYLAHGPDAQLAPRVRQALQQAEAASQAAKATPAGTTPAAGG